MFDALRKFDKHNRHARFPDQQLFTVLTVVSQYMHCKDRSEHDDAFMLALAVAMHVLGDHPWAKDTSAGL